MKVIAVLYDDPVKGYPKTYVHDSIPKIRRYPDGKIVPTPKKIDFKPGQLLGSVSGELGLRKFLEDLIRQVVLRKLYDLKARGIIWEISSLPLYFFTQLQP